jgi:hypothetical protein
VVHLEKTAAKIPLDVGNPRIQLDCRFEFSASSFVLVLLHVERAQVIVDDIGARVGARKSKQLSLSATHVAAAQNFLSPLQTLLDVVLTRKGSRSSRNEAESQEAKVEQGSGPTGSYGVLAERFCRQGLSLESRPVPWQTDEASFNGFQHQFNSDATLVS